MLSSPGALGRSPYLPRRDTRTSPYYGLSRRDTFTEEDITQKACAVDGMDPSRTAARQPQRARPRRIARIRSHDRTGGAGDRHAESDLTQGAIGRRLRVGRRETGYDWYDLRPCRTAELPPKPPSDPSAHGLTIFRSIAR